jgi:hypothetical protein
MSDLTFTARTFAAASGATFGSAGTVNGNLSIAQGTTLQIVSHQAVTPGRSLDLITTSGGITGNYTNMIKPASLFGFIVQDAGSITPMGQFLNDPAFSPQVQGAIAYVNGVLVAGAAWDALFETVPDLYRLGSVRPSRFRPS